jgi:hypothetical protein
MAMQARGQVSRCTAGIKSTSMMRQRKKRLKTRVRCSDETNMHKGIGADHLATMLQEVLERLNRHGGNEALSLPTSSTLLSDRP